MAKFYASITPAIRAFIEEQHIFFVATAPLSAEGHINLSPKGMDTFRVLSEHQIAYLDVTGSGNETAAHITENGRITIMFCAFKGDPNIVRLYGQGRAILPGDPEWDDLIKLYPPLPGIRQIITSTIDKTQTSCGYAVPFMDYAGERETLIKWAEHKGEEGVAQYQQEKNIASLDGLPTPFSTKS
ncbi:MAG: pyridoxamine 5'-phosphate oxidase family protein [Anaerolinea sp.]|nr:pyridoxamine 5'-phosphate oxidase family protein [Anaerolinea sp.]